MAMVVAGTNEMPSSEWLGKHSNTPILHHFPPVHFSAARLESVLKPVTMGPMNFIYACAAWLGIGLVLGIGLYLAAVKGTPWLLIVAVIGFVVAVGKIGCQTK
jgi:hypothetical protein